MIEPLYQEDQTLGSARHRTEFSKIQNEVTLNQVYIGPEAAREIAQRIEAEGGFWGPRMDQDARARKV